MTDGNRKSDLRRRLQLAALVACLPVVMGAGYSWSCITPVHGIFPWGCHPGAAGCVAAQNDAGVITSEDLTEKLFVDAQASSAFSINYWSAINTGLEQCGNMDPGDFLRVTPIPSLALPGDPKQFEDCGPAFNYGSCYCRYVFKEPTDDFNVFLDKFIAANKCLGVNDGRSALIQLGPIFTFNRRVPPYLYNKSFDSKEMIQSFAQLWDEMSRILVQDKFNPPPGTILAPEWIISIGNEVNLYLDNPGLIAPVDGGGSPTASQNAWTNYGIFYQRARQYVQGVDPVNIGNENLMNKSARRLSWVTFSTTWSTNCSPGWMLAHPALPSCTNYEFRLDTYKSMLTGSSFASYTYYPYPDCPPSLLGKDAMFFQGAVYADFTQMKNAAINAENQVGRQLPIVLQEVGFQSSCATMNPPGALDYKNHLFEHEQAAFVEGALNAFTDYNEQNGTWISELDWWLQTNGLTTWPPQSPWELPRIVSFNTFMLHDFSDFSDVPDSCPYSTANADGTPGTTPTKLGIFLCSLGLRKRTGEPKAAWAPFVAASQAIDAPGVDPERTCP